MKKLLIILFFTPVLINSCSQNNEFETMQASPDESNNSPQNIEQHNDSVKLVKTADLTCKVEDVEKASRAVSLLAREHGGMVFTNTYISAEGNASELNISADSLLVIKSFIPQATIVARVPSENLEEFLFKLSETGYHTARSGLKIEDKSIAYLHNQLKYNNRKEVLKETKSTLGKLPATLQKIEVKDEMSNQFVSNRYIDTDVKYSRVDISLYQNAIIKKEMIANYNLSGYKLSFSKRLGQSLQSGWEYFQNLIIALASLWVFLIIGLVVYFAYRNGRKIKYSPAKNLNA